MTTSNKRKTVVEPESVDDDEPPKKKSLLRSLKRKHENGGVKRRSCTVRAALNKLLKPGLRPYFQSAIDLASRSLFDIREHAQHIIHLSLVDADDDDDAFGSFGQSEVSAAWMLARDAHDFAKREKASGPSLVMRSCFETYEPIVFETGVEQWWKAITAAEKKIAYPLIERLSKPLARQHATCIGEAAARQLPFLCRSYLASRIAVEIDADHPFFGPARFKAVLSALYEAFFEGGNVHDILSDRKCGSPGEDDPLIAACERAIGELGSAIAVLPPEALTMMMDAADEDDGEDDGDGGGADAESEDADEERPGAEQSAVARVTASTFGVRRKLLAAIEANVEELARRRGRGEPAPAIGNRKACLVPVLKFKAPFLLLDATSFEALARAAAKLAALDGSEDGKTAALALDILLGALKRRSGEDDETFFRRRETAKKELFEEVFAIDRLARKAGKKEPLWRFGMHLKTDGVSADVLFTREKPGQRSVNEAAAEAVAKENASRIAAGKKPLSESGPAFKERLTRARAAAWKELRERAASAADADFKRRIETGDFDSIVGGDPGSNFPLAWARYDRAAAENRGSMSKAELIRNPVGGWSKARFYEEAGINAAKAATEKLIAAAAISHPELEQYIVPDAPTPKTASRDRIIDFIKHRLRMLPALRDALVADSKKARRIRFGAYVRRQKATHRFACDVAGGRDRVGYVRRLGPCGDSYDRGRRTLVFLGDGDFGSARRGSKTSMHGPLVRAVKRALNCLEQCEFRTSKLCCCCHGVLKSMQRWVPVAGPLESDKTIRPHERLRSRDGRYFTNSWKARVCPNTECPRFRLHRDKVNSSLNILDLGLWRLGFRDMVPHASMARFDRETQLDEPTRDDEDSDQRDGALV
jgi:hypothetical protein